MDVVYASLYLLKRAEVVEIYVVTWEARFFFWTYPTKIPSDHQNCTNDAMSILSEVSLFSHFKDEY